MANHERLEALYRNVRDKLKCGDLDNFRKADVRKIDRSVKAGVADCPFRKNSLQSHFFELQSFLSSLGDSMADDPLYWKAVSVSLEFRDYLEGLLPESRAWLGARAEEFLEEFGRVLDECRRAGLKLSTPADPELLKEKARLVSVYAQQLCRARRYKEAEGAIKTARRLLLRVLRPKGTRCHTVLGALAYAESKLLRDRGHYEECEKKLSRAIDYYSVWVTDRSDAREDIARDIALASYKVAIFLGDSAWCKNSRGLCADALAFINAARFLIQPTGWELGKASLDLIYADVVRALAGTGADRLGEAATIAERSYDKFKEHAHKRMTARSAFTLALLNYYGDNVCAAEEKLDEVEQFSTQAGDTKWLANCWNLRARVRLEQAKPEEALSLLSRSIADAGRAGLKNQLVVAYIVKAEAHCRLRDYEEALASLDEAREENEKRIRAGYEASIERNKGWILLSLAQTYLLSEEIGQAWVCLGEAERLSSVRELKWLHEKARQIRRVLEGGSKDFVIERGIERLNWEEHADDLAAWLIYQAELQTGSKENKKVAAQLGIHHRRLGQLKSRIKKKRGR